ncbi:MAG: cellulase family glycosylhydrolase, partial [Solirubrobacterales bacterium]
MASAENLQPLHAVRGKKAAIRDIRGRQVILRGINATALQDNFMANPNLPGSAPLTDVDLAHMRDMGVNVIRLVISWSALEPRRGSLNPSYVARIKDIVARASRYDIYTIIDMHNDGWSKYLSTPWGERCPKGRFPGLGWDGAPEWATKTNG